MRIYLPPMDIGEKEGFAAEKEGFTAEKDLFGGAELGKGMTNLVSTISEPLVIAFDGEWGTGKTTFLKMWAGELRKEGFPVVYFDAFENDYVEDAFAVLVREIIALVEAKTPAGKKTIGDFKEKAVKLGSQLARGALKIGTMAAVKATTLDLISVADVKGAIADNAGDSVDDYMRDLLSEPQKQKNIVTEFIGVLEGLPKLIAPPAAGEAQKPLVFIIDELDRCKPLFALQLLERIKHFMSVPNVHFVLGVHMEQLKRSVQFAYGGNIDATSYLQKFINLTIANTDGARQPHEHPTKIYIEHLKTGLELPETDDVLMIQEFVERVAQSNGYSLRVLERIFTNIALAMAFAGKNEFFPAPLVAGLCILKVVEPKLFSKAKKGQLEYKEVTEIFAFDSSSSDSAYKDMKQYGLEWEYVLAAELTPELEPLERDFYDYGLLQSRMNILPYVANEIVDRLKPNE